MIKAIHATGSITKQLVQRRKHAWTRCRRHQLQAVVCNVVHSQHVPLEAPQPMVPLSTTRDPQKGRPGTRLGETQESPVLNGKHSKHVME